MHLVPKPLIWSETEVDHVVIKTSIWLSLVGMITKSFAFEKQQDLYQKKATFSRTPVQRLGNQARNCKMDYRDLRKTPTTTATRTR